jgi:hypothetical protein
VKPKDWAVNLALALIYANVYAWVYSAFLHVNFGYVGGMELYARPMEFLIVMYTIAVLPILLYRGMRATSSAIAVLIYLLLYVPIIITFGLGSGQSHGHIIGIQLTFLLGMAMLFLADGVVLKNPIPLNLDFSLMPAVMAATALATLYAVWVYGGNLRFVSFGAELYEQRFLADEVAGGGVVVGYVTSWLSTVLIPLCLAHGFAHKRPWYVIMPVVSSVILYMAAANKITIVLPVVYAGMYFLMRGRLQSIFPLLTLATVGVIAGLIFASGEGEAAFVAASLILYRTIGNGGWITQVYYEFFSFHPQTEFSHVMGIKELTKPYPYGELGIGQVVGTFHWNPTMNANANFWATDGIAGLGLPGVLIISGIGVVLFVAINTFTRPYDKLFVLLSFLPFISILLNQSMFSSVWSGGGLFLLLFFLINKREFEVLPPAPPGRDDEPQTRLEPA